MINAIPKSFEKPILYGVLIAGGFLAISIYRKGVGGTASDLAGGVVKGVIGAATGVVGGVVSATGDIIADGYNSIPNAIKPSSPDNIANQATNKIGAALTGDKNFTLGGWIYDVTH